MKTAEKHPTCAAVLLLLEQATGLLRTRIGEGAVTEGKACPEILAMGVGYSFEVLRNRAGPFSHAEARDLIQRAFCAGWKASGDYKKLKVNRR